jgi:hypothetical protein
MYIRRVATRHRCKSLPCWPKSHVDVDTSAERPNKEPTGVLRTVLEGTMDMDANSQRKSGHANVVEYGSKSSVYTATYIECLQNAMAAE